MSNYTQTRLDFVLEVTCNEKKGEERVFSKGVFSFCCDDIHECERGVVAAAASSRATPPC